jgi:hypothetical protein
MMKFTVLSTETPTLNARALAINLFEQAAERYGEGFSRLSNYEQSAIINQMHQERLKTLSNELGYGLQLD